MTQLVGFRNKNNSEVLCSIYRSYALFAQDILLLKGEGEVKLNMAMGKGELAMRCHGAAGQEMVRSQLQEVEDAWATLLVTTMSCHRYLKAIMLMDLGSLVVHIIISNKNVLHFFFCTP